MTIMHVDLQSNEWRDANLDTLPQWHPCLKEFAADLDALDNAFREFATRYRDFLLRECDGPVDGIIGHVSEEMSLYLYNRFDRTLADIWDEPWTAESLPSGEAVAVAMD